MAPVPGVVTPDDKIRGIWGPRAGSANDQLDDCESPGKMRPRRQLVIRTNNNFDNEPVDDVPDADTETDYDSLDDLGPDDELADVTHSMLLGDMGYNFSDVIEVPLKKAGLSPAKQTYNGADKPHRIAAK